MYTGPNISDDGLVLSLDAANRKSYVSGSTTWTDLTRRGNSGTLVNGPTFSSANLGSIVFDGTNDYVDLPSLIPRIYTNFTISLWVYPTRISIPTTNISLITTDWSAGGTNYMIYQQNNKFIGAIGNGISAQDPVLTSNTTIVANTWYNVTLLCNGTSQTLYVNGINDVSQIGLYSGGLTSNPRRLATDNIGTAGYFFQGNISNALFYNRALSAQEILQNYEGLKSRYGL